MRVNLLIDLSGTLHIGDTACAGAIQALRRLCTAKPAGRTGGDKNKACTSLAIRFCSNTTKESTQDLQSRLVRAGFASDDVRESRIVTSLQACKAACVELRCKPLLLLTPSAQATFRTGEDDDKEALQHAFFATADTPPSKLGDKERARLRSCDAVVVGLAPALFSAEWLDEAFRILASEYTDTPKRLIATHRALYYRPASDEALSMGPGAYIAALEAASHRRSDETVVCGKPSKRFLQLCLEEMHGDHDDDSSGGAQESHNIIVGDDVDADLGGGAVELGLDRVLVQTGKYREGDERRSPVEQPVRLFASFAHFVQHLFDSGVLEPAPSSL